MATNDMDHKCECRNIREDMLRISKSSGHGHLPSCFSIVEILYAIYDTIKNDPRDPFLEDRDIFILSKGHASLAHYCTLAHFGYFGIEKVYEFGSFMSNFGCHADRFKIPGIEVSTGSLGHGIGLAVGIALALKIKKSNRRVYTIIGDGEANEGTVWESIMVATNLKLDNLTIIYDNNMSHSRGLQIYNPIEHFRGFDCYVVEIDGHNVDVIKDEMIKKNNNVRVIIANTKKGYNCKTLMDNQYEWHRKSPNDDEFKNLMKELYEGVN